MSFADQDLLPSGTYALINVQYNRCISFDEQNECLSTSVDDYGWSVTLLANKKWTIQGPPGVFMDIHIQPGGKKGEDVISWKKNPPGPHELIIKRFPLKPQSYIIYSPSLTHLLWSLPHGGDGTAPQLSSNSDSHLWKFKKIELPPTGFPTGKFRIRSVGTSHYWTPTWWTTDKDGNTVSLWTLGNSSPAQTFFVNSRGNLSCGNGTELDVMGNALIMTLNRQRTEPWPNPWSHPLPTFSYSEESKMITVKFYADPVVSDHWPRAESEWKDKEYALAARSVVATIVPSFQKIAKWAPHPTKSTTQWVDKDVGYERPGHRWDNLGIEEKGKNMGPQDLNRMQWEIEKL